MKVAIDGPAGAGKSTVAREIACRRGFVYLDTGAMYRSVALVAREQGVPLDDVDGLARIARAAQISFVPGPDGSQRVLIDGRDVSEAIRTPGIDACVSAVAGVSQVRDAMVAQQRKLAEGFDVVAEGRDIGTVVFPDAQVKVFLTADARARAHRRCVQNAARFNSQADGASEDEVYKQIVQRDLADSTRQTAPLVAADDAVHVDSSALDIEGVVARICALIDAVNASQEA